ncbi:outer membrane beta-barrel protein [candidate division KSB1 bacterium]|nr:outer membrane beta-barrel protein [candidate division KSB1 bacterium]
MKIEKFVVILFAVFLFSSSYLYSRSPFSFAVSGGYSLYAFDDVNNLLNNIDRSDINGGLAGGLNLGYFINSAISLNLRVGALFAESNEDFYITGEAGPQPLGTGESSYAFRSVPVGAGVIYHVPLNSFTLNIGGFVDKHFAERIVEIDTKGLAKGYKNSTSKSAIGFHGFIGPEFAVNEHMSLAGEFGYRNAEIKNFTGAEEFIPEELTVDFSGTYFAAWFRYRF